MIWESWSKFDFKGLARYVTPECRRWFNLGASRFDLQKDPDEKLRVVEAIYDALIEYEISYDIEGYHPSGSVQVIRTPEEILKAPKKGTCLDLATLFCGLCLDNELLPILIVFEGHALAAVSLKQGLREWELRKELAFFEKDLLADPAPIRQLIDEGSYAAVECTGFARSQKLQEMVAQSYPETLERQGGILSFNRAVAAGREQLDESTGRPFKFAIDIAVAHYLWRIEPFPIDVAPLVNIFQAYESSGALSQFIRVSEFKATIEERTSNFVGREFIFDAIDDHLKNPAFSSGYIMIRGEPGIGKTALAAQLVKQRGYVHHFNIAPQNIRSTRDFLKNTCAQLIVSYHLNYQTLPDDAAKDSGFLVRLLGEAADHAENLPLVVVIDALDEAEDADLSTTVNRLYLPRDLPSGVFFIVTSRTKIDYRLDVAKMEEILIREEDPQNLEDVRKFIVGFIEDRRETMEARISTWDVSRDEFVNEITARSEGNFMYIVHILNDILKGRLTKDNVDSIRDLPKGLEAYYRRHWRDMKAQDKNRFERYQRPVLCFLATARESVSIEQLMQWTDLDPGNIKSIIDEWWEFLNEEKAEALFRIYHRSFAEFLDKEEHLQWYHDQISLGALRKIPNFLDDTKPRD